ncbi:uncharacterized protein F5891DRAFT_987083 [Suillus fuscotomentosus]|uniref:Uncharacterized protein n=1 Tax=Suillus fuscotomentosus TaxID=1912939 RepID=A0AAD4DQN6_9AGAM|nr:uncharacterized protein F5891DRAFT_987083 [Suillus fuscotomentosus]KAG1890485.1 hypothetical protein F5891DRAFT_987083 [Suillus fuscotomentosus]
MSFFTPTPPPLPQAMMPPVQLDPRLLRSGSYNHHIFPVLCTNFVVYALLCCFITLFGRALNLQLESTEDDGVHGGMLIPLVFCGTWMRPPRTEEDGSVDQSEWSSIQPVSASSPVSSHVACQSALAVGKSESTNLPKAVMIAVMIQMPSPVFQCRNDRKGRTYNPARPDNPLSEYQIGVAQIHRSVIAPGWRERQGSCLVIGPRWIEL